MTAARPPLPQDDERHGRYTTYVNYRCRCDACRTAARIYKARPPRPTPAIEHGTRSAYTNRGCRCDLCREANRVALLDYRRRQREEQ